MLHLSAGSIPAALATLWVLKNIGPADAAVQRIMTTTLGLALLLTAGATLYKAARGKAAPRNVVAGFKPPRRATGVCPCCLAR